MAFSSERIKSGVKKQIKLSYSSTSSANNSDEEGTHISKKKSLSETDNNSHANR